MIESVRQNIIRLIDLVQDGSFNHDHFRLLCIDLRDSIPSGKDPKVAEIYDLFNFAAHPNSRERGTTFNLSRTIARQLATSITKGGAVTIERLLDVDVADHFMLVLDVLAIEHNRSKMKAQEKSLREHLYRMLDGVALAINAPPIESGTIYCDPTNRMIFVSLKLGDVSSQIGEMKLTASGATMRFRLS
jgi:hypothetical protein